MSEEKDISILNQERFVQQMAEIDRLRARVAELERERDEAIRQRDENAKTLGVWMGGKET